MKKLFRKIFFVSDGLSTQTSSGAHSAELKGGLTSEAETQTISFESIQDTKQDAHQGAKEEYSISNSAQIFPGNKVNILTQDLLPDTPDRSGRPQAKASESSVGDPMVRSGNSLQDGLLFHESDQHFAACCQNCNNSGSRPAPTHETEMIRLQLQRLKLVPNQVKTKDVAELDICEDGGKQSLSLTTKLVSSDSQEKSFSDDNPTQQNPDGVFANGIATHSTQTSDIEDNGPDKQSKLDDPKTPDPRADRNNADPKSAETSEPEPSEDNDMFVDIAAFDELPIPPDIIIREIKHPYIRENGRTSALDGKGTETPTSGKREENNNRKDFGLASTKQVSSVGGPSFGVWGQIGCRFWQNICICCGKMTRSSSPSPRGPHPIFGNRTGIADDNDSLSGNESWESAPSSAPTSGDEAEDGDSMEAQPSSVCLEEVESIETPPPEMVSTESQTSKHLVVRFAPQETQRTPGRKKERYKSPPPPKPPTPRRKSRLAERKMLVRRKRVPLELREAPPPQAGAPASGRGSATPQPATDPSPEPHTSGGEAGSSTERNVVAKRKRRRKSRKQEAAPPSDPATPGLTPPGDVNQSHSADVSQCRSAFVDMGSSEVELVETPKMDEEAPVEKAKPETPGTEKCRRELLREPAKRPAVSSNLYDVPGEHFQRAVYRMDDGERSERCTKGDLPPTARREKVKTRGTPFKHLPHGAKPSRAETASKSPDRDMGKTKGYRTDGRDRSRTKGSRVDERDRSKGKGGRGDERDRSKGKGGRGDERDRSKGKGGRGDERDRSKGKGSKTEEREPSTSEENGRKDKEEKDSAKIGKHLPRVPRSRHRFRYKGGGDFARHQRKEADVPQGRESKDNTLAQDGKLLPASKKVLTSACKNRRGAMNSPSGGGGDGAGRLPRELQCAGAGMEGVEDTRHFDLLPVAVLMKSRQALDEGEYGPSRVKHGKQKRASGKNRKKLVTDLFF